MDAKSIYSLDKGEGNLYQPHDKVADHELGCGVRRSRQRVGQVDPAIAEHGAKADR